MREVKKVLTLDPDEYRILLHCLIHLRNTLIAEGKYTDAVDEIILKLDRSKKRKYWF